jgi:hypothetical protein
MTIITPAGKNDFQWSPREDALVKTASTGEKAPKSDRDILYEIAKKVVKAQCCDGTGPHGMGGGIGGGMEDSQVENEAIVPSEATEIASEVPATGDAVKAVQELADKAAKAEEVASKVQEAVSKVEEAVQEVKSVVGDVAGAVGDDAGQSPDEVVMEVEVEDEAPEGEEKGEGEEHEKSETPEEEKDEHEEGEKDEADESDEKSEDDEIVQKSCMGKSKKIKMETIAGQADDFMKLSKISPETRKKVTSLWKDYLGYDAAYVKLMTTDYEK